jgi:hypothetical protein
MEQFMHWSKISLAMLRALALVGVVGILIGSSDAAFARKGNGNGHSNSSKIRITHGPIIVKHKHRWYFEHHDHQHRKPIRGPLPPTPKPPPSMQHAARPYDPDGASSSAQAASAGSSAGRCSASTRSRTRAHADPGRWERSRQAANQGAVRDETMIRFTPSDHGPAPVARMSEATSGRKAPHIALLMRATGTAELVPASDIRRLAFHVSPTHPIEKETRNVFDKFARSQPSHRRRRGHDPVGANGGRCRWRLSRSSRPT